MLETTYVTPEVAAEMLGTSVEMVLLAGAEGRIQFYGLTDNLPEVRVEEYPPAEGGLKSEGEILIFDFLPIMAEDVASVIRNGTTRKILTLFFRPEQGRSVTLKLLSPETLSFPRHCIYVRRDDIQAIIDSKQTPPAGSVPSGEAVMRLSSQKARAANNDSRILEAVLAHFGIDPGKRGLAKKVAFWTRDTVSVDTVRDRLAKVEEILDKKAELGRPPSS